MSTTVDKVRRNYSAAKDKLSDQGRQALEEAFRSNESFVLLPHSASQEAQRNFSSAMRTVVLPASDWQELFGRADVPSWIATNLPSRVKYKPVLLVYA